MDICHLNSSQCVHGRCTLNQLANTTYCHCDPCYEGILCDVRSYTQHEFNRGLAYFIVCTLGLCFSLLNNGLCLELFITCKKIRLSNCGVYLIIYSILSIVGSILGFLDGTLKYFPNVLYDYDRYPANRCIIAKVGHTVLVYLCLCFSAWVAVERSLVLWFEVKTNHTRRRSFFISIGTFVVAIGCAIPFLLYKCDLEKVPSLKVLRGFYLWFFFVVAVTLYCVTSLILLINFSRRIRLYGIENSSLIRTFGKYLRTHLFIFVPPITFIALQIPYTVVFSFKKAYQSYYPCGISLAEFIAKFLLAISPKVPVVFTWLLFVYPSKVLMTQFYLHTWSGKWVTKIILSMRRIMPLK